MKSNTFLLHTFSVPCLCLCLTVKFAKYPNDAEGLRLTVTYVRFQGSPWNQKFELVNDESVKIE